MTTMNKMTAAAHRRIAQVLVSLASTLSASAQEAQDSIQYGGWDHFRIGGYGEINSTFKSYGTNRFYGGAEGNAKERNETPSASQDL